MRIHQVTDLHVPDDDVDPMLAHVRENVLRQFSFVAGDNSDLLVITGDLTMKDASEIGCRWIHAHLPDVPVIVIPGNHDDPEIIQKVFGRWPREQNNAECSLIFLDTSSDRLPAEQAEFLAGLTPAQTRVLFLHHPPCLIGAGFMSKNQPLLNHAEAAHAIARAGIEHVFCGHYHNSAQVSCDGFELYLTPSPAFQIPLEAEQFEMEEFQPAVRRIDACADKVTSELVYV